MIGGNYEPMANPQNHDDFYVPPPTAPTGPSPSQAPSTEPHPETFASSASHSGGVVQRKKSQLDVASRSNSICQKKEGKCKKAGNNEEILENAVFRHKLALRTCYTLWISILITSLISFAIAIVLFFAL